MAIDPSIIGQLQQYQAPDLGASMQRAMQMRQMQQRDQLMQIEMAKMAQAEQQQKLAMARDAQARQIWQQAGGDDEKLLSGLRNAGLHEQYLKAEEQFSKRQKEGAEIGKIKNESLLKRQEGLARFATRLGSNPTPDHVSNVLLHGINRGEITREEGAAIAEQLDTVPQQQWGRTVMGMVMKPDDWLKINAPDRKVVDLGGSQAFVDMNPMTNPNQGPMAKTATPGEVMTNDRGIESNRISLGQLGVAQANSAETRRNNAAQNAIAQGNLRVAQGNLGVNQGRLTLDQTAPKGVGLDTAQGPIIYDPRTGAARPITVDGQAVPPKQSESTSKEINSLDSQTALVNEAMRAAAQSPNAFNFMRGAAASAGPVGEYLGSKTQSPEEQQARAFVFNNVSKVINERAGAAQSAQELARLRSFLPGDFDSADQVQNKLKAFQQYLKTSRDVYATPQNQRQQPAAEAPAPAAAPKEQAPKGQTFNSLPMPQQYTGRVMRNPETGQRFRSDGRAWVPVQ